ncbi:HAMP domain-containing histidine kinase [Bacteroidales bacterium OttesenSCG-928-K03]|nr:HAMP domain-containing histidine kinase [Bacteroidales bacterium OttesenSCG-928-L14]MDL2243145.1 HAMP domain-containing histidine kinase [Bacteroidales bacterium OttesenSCG-928-K03]
MKLIYHIIIRISIVLSIVLAGWATFFYFSMIDEINDETDDYLEDYSEQIMMRFLAGEDIPSKSINSNNQYYIHEVTEEYAQYKPHVCYIDSMVYIPLKQETEPARILTTIYKDEVGKYYELVVSTPTIEKKDLKESILYRIIFLYLTLLLIIILINFWVYKRSTKPLHKLLNWMDEYKVGDNNIELQNTTDIIEFKKLNDAAVRNMQRTEEIFEKQKQFIGNASHEIQTPLAVCRNRLENLMEDESLTENQLEELAKTYQTLEYITKLNKTLLLLTKIDNKQFIEKNDIGLNSLVNKFIQDYKEAYSHLNITVEIKESGIFKIRMSETLASILVNNLIKNSYTHNTENGKIIIEISSSELKIGNTGQDFALNSKIIFERFYQSDKKEGSIGLGLSLVKSICDYENLSIKYTFEDNLHWFCVTT